MCEPTTLAIVAGSAAVAGGIQKGAAAQRAAQMQGDLLDANAATADTLAADARDRGMVAEGKVRLQGGQLQAHQKSQFAAAGVDVNAGSAVDVMSSTAGLTELEAKIVANNAAREAWGFETQARGFRKQAQFTRAAGDAAQTGSILGGVGQAASYGAATLRVK
jgi:hypothetical protein